MTRSSREQSVIEASCCHKAMTTDSPHLRDLLVKLPALTALDLSHNKMTAIPNLTWCPNVKALNLNHNEVADRTLFSPLYKPRMRMLVELRLKHNDIVSLKGFAAAPNLLYLDLCNNQVRNLKGLEDMSQLRTLLLANNHVGGGLIAFTFMKNLVELSMANNPVARKGNLYKAAIANYCPTLSKFDGKYLTRSTRAVKGGAGADRERDSTESPDATMLSNTNASYASFGYGNHTHNSSGGLVLTPSALSSSAFTSSSTSPVLRSHEMMLRSKGSPGYSQMHERATAQAKRAGQSALDKAVPVSPYPRPLMRPASAGKKTKNRNDNSSRNGGGGGGGDSGKADRGAAAGAGRGADDKGNNNNSNSSSSSSSKPAWQGTKGRSLDPAAAKSKHGVGTSMGDNVTTKPRRERLNPYPIRNNPKEANYSLARLSMSDEGSDALFGNVIMTQDYSQSQIGSRVSSEWSAVAGLGMDSGIFIDYSRASDDSTAHNNNNNSSSVSRGGGNAQHVADGPTFHIMPANQSQSQYSLAHAQSVGGTLVYKGAAEDSKLPWRAPPNPLPRQFKGADVTLIDHDQLMQNEIFSPNRYKMKNCMERVKADKLERERLLQAERNRDKWLSPDLQRDSATRHVTSAAHDQPLATGAHNTSHEAFFADLTKLEEYTRSSSPSSFRTTNSSRNRNNNTGSPDSGVKMTRIQIMREYMGREKRKQLEKEEELRAQEEGRDLPEGRRVMLSGSEEDDDDDDDEEEEEEDYDDEEVEDVDGPAMYTRARLAPPLPVEMIAQDWQEEEEEEEEEEEQSDDNNVYVYREEDPSGAAGQGAGGLPEQWSPSSAIDLQMMPVMNMQVQQQMHRDNTPQQQEYYGDEIYDDGDGVDDDEQAAALRYFADADPDLAVELSVDDSGMSSFGTGVGIEIGLGGALQLLPHQDFSYASSSYHEGEGNDDDDAAGEEGEGDVSDAKIDFIDSMQTSLDESERLAQAPVPALPARQRPSKIEELLAALERKKLASEQQQQQQQQQQQPAEHDNNHNHNHRHRHHHQNKKQQQQQDLPKQQQQQQQQGAAGPADHHDHHHRHHNHHRRQQQQAHNSSVTSEDTHNDDSSVHHHHHDGNDDVTSLLVRMAEIKTLREEAFAKLEAKLRD